MTSECVVKENVGDRVQSNQHGHYQRNKHKRDYYSGYGQSARTREQADEREHRPHKPDYPACYGNPAAEYAHQGKDESYCAHRIGASLLLAIGLPWLWRRLRAITIGLLRPVAVGLLLSVGLLWPIGLLRSVAVRRLLLLPATVGRLLLLLRSITVGRLTVLILPWLPGLLRLSGRLAGRTGRRGVGLIAHIII